MVKEMNTPKAIKLLSYNHVKHETNIKKSLKVLHGEVK